jgi:hypothetical protein
MTSMSEIDFWAIPILLKRMGWDLKNAIAFQSHHVLSKNPIHVKRIMILAEQSTVSNEIFHSLNAHMNGIFYVQMRLNKIK